MENILVNVYVPSLDCRYDVQIPLFLPIREVIRLLAEMLCELTDGRYTSSGQEFLSSTDQDLLFRQECTLGDYGICDGEHLLFT